MAAENSFTVAICTYNRADSLDKTLESLCAAKKPDAPWELLVIDNNSKDHTAAVARQFEERLPLRYIFELQQGQTFARNRAIVEYANGVLIFTDDDVRVDNNWLVEYQNAINAYPHAGYFGGRILPDWDGPKPGWLREPCLTSIDGLLVWFDRGSETRPFEKDEPTPFGASFGIKRKVTDALKGFRTDLGPRPGVSRGRGDETEFLLRAKALGTTGVYAGKAICWHYTEMSRLTLSAFYRYGIESGRSHKAIRGVKFSGSRLRAGLFLARGMLQLVKGRGDRFRQCIINAGIEMGQRP
jgi:glycosyltransferase involved in cell wall biosynthesis